MRRDIKPIYTAATLMAAESARNEMLEHWAKKYPAIKGLWLNAWEWFIPFIDYEVEIRRVICSTNATGKGQIRWVTGWKPALNAFARPLSPTAGRTARNNNENCQLHTQ